MASTRKVKNMVGLALTMLNSGDLTGIKSLLSSNPRVAQELFAVQENVLLFFRTVLEADISYMFSIQGIIRELLKVSEDNAVFASLFACKACKAKNWEIVASLIAFDEIALEFTRLAIDKNSPRMIQAVTTLRDGVDVTLLTSSEAEEYRRLSWEVQKHERN